GPGPGNGRQRSVARHSGLAHRCLPALAVRRRAVFPAGRSGESRMDRPGSGGGTGTGGRAVFPLPHAALSRPQPPCPNETLGGVHVSARRQSAGSRPPLGSPARTADAPDVARNLFRERVQYFAAEFLRIPLLTTSVLL